MAKLNPCDLANAVQARLINDGLLEGSIFCAEVGARKPAAREMSREPFYALAQRRILAFEADSTEAQRLMSRLDRASGIEIVDAALGDRQGAAKLYITRHPKCSSLYCPNQPLIDRYQGLDVMRLDRIVEVRVTTLDAARRERGWPRIDFIKMDVQGGELDIIRGAGEALADTVAIVSEVSFQPFYVDQPLFGDVAAALATRDFEFYRFVHLGGRARTGTRNDQMQVLQGDALFVRPPENVSVDAAARLAILATLYGALDVAEVSLKRIGGAVGNWFGETIRLPRPGPAAVLAHAAQRLLGRFVRRGRAYGRGQSA